MDQIDGPVPPVDLQYHQLARLAAHDDEAACDRLVHLDDSGDVVLAALQINLAQGFIPFLAGPVDAR